jgi:integrase
MAQQSSGRALEKQTAPRHAAVGIARQIVEGRLSAVQSGPFFIAETGTPFTAAHIGHYLLARRDKLPISKFTTHDLRRTVATMLAEMGIALDLVAAARIRRQRDENPRQALRAHRFGGAEKDCLGSVAPPAPRNHRWADSACGMSRGLRTQRTPPLLDFE